MRKLLFAINVLLACAIVWVVFFWHPEPDEMPLPDLAQFPLTNH